MVTRTSAANDSAVMIESTATTSVKIYFRWKEKDTCLVCVRRKFLCVAAFASQSLLEGPAIVEGQGKRADGAELRFLRRRSEELMDKGGLINSPFFL